MSIFDESLKPSAMSDAGRARIARPLHVIAREIYRTWPKVNYAAKPYLEAMTSLDSIGDRFIHDSGHSVVAYFLSNATTWRGEDAKRIKAELKAMLARK